MKIRAPYGLLVAVLAGGMLAACAAPSGTGGGNAATVNGKPITNADYNRQVKSVTDSLIAQKSADPATPEGKAMLDQVKSDILNQLVESELMRQAAQKEGVAVTDAEVTAQVAQAIKDAGGDKTFQDSLKQSNMTEKDFRDYVIRDQMIYERLYTKVTAGLPTTAEQVHSRHILLNTQQEANDVLARLQKGEDFATLAQQLSQDTGSKDQGGDLGFFPRGVVDPAFEDAIFKMLPNAMTIVKTDYGYHVVQVLEKATDRALSPEIQQTLGEMTMNTYFDSLRAQAKIVILAKLAATPTPSQ